MSTRRRSRGASSAASEPPQASMPAAAKDSRRASHNASEKRRADRINQHIAEIRTLLEDQNRTFRKNKAGILCEAVDFLHELLREVDSLRLAQAPRTTRQGAELPPPPPTDPSVTPAATGPAAASRTASGPQRIPVRLSQPAGAAAGAEGPAAPAAAAPIDYRLVVSHAPLPMAISAVNGRFLDCNRLFRHFSGYDLGDLKKQTMFGLTHPDDMRHTFAAITQLFSSPSSTHTISKRCTMRTGTFRVNVALSLVRDAAQEPLFFVCAILSMADPRTQAPAAGPFPQQAGPTGLRHPASAAAPAAPPHPGPAAAAAAAGDPRSRPATAPTASAAAAHTHRHRPSPRGPTPPDEAAAAAAATGFGARKRRRAFDAAEARSAPAPMPVPAAAAAAAGDMNTRRTGPPRNGANGAASDPGEDGGGREESATPRQHASARHGAPRTKPDGRYALASEYRVPRSPGSMSLGSLGTPGGLGLTDEGDSWEAGFTTAPAPFASSTLGGGTPMHLADDGGGFAFDSFTGQDAATNGGHAANGMDGDASDGYSSPRSS